MTEHISPESSSTVASNTDDKSGEFSLLELLIVLAKHKKLIIGLPSVISLIAAVYVVLATPIYTATAKILPPQQSQSSSAAMLQQMGGLASLASNVVGFRNPNDVYVAMLKSRTVAYNLIERFGLMERYESKYASWARQVLDGKTRISLGLKDGIITIDVDDEDPKHAAQLANGYVEELEKLTQVLAVTEASQRRLFFERQLAQAVGSLAKAESLARQALEQRGLVKVDDQGRAMVENTARLRAQLTVKEVQIGVMRTFATERNPELQRAQKELESLKRELAKMEGVRGARTETGGASGEGMESIRLLRDVKYYESLYELMAKQVELAKIEEAKDSSVIQILDKAIVPDFKSKPNRRLVVLASAIAALFVGVLLAFVREAFVAASKDPRQIDRMRNLMHLITWRGIT